MSTTFALLIALPVLAVIALLAAVGAGVALVVVLAKEMGVS